MQHLCHAVGFNGKLILPEGIDYIGQSTFYGCSGINGDLTIPQSVKEIGNGAFSDCSGINGTLTISMKDIPGEDIFGRTNVNKLVLKSTVENICDSSSSAVFARMNLNNGIVIEKGIKSIGKNVFEGIEINGDLIIPDSVIEIGDGAFNGASVTGKIEVPSSVTNLKNGAFVNTKSKNLTLGINDIPQMTFVTSQYDEIILKDTVEKVESEAFGGCRVKEDLIIPNSIKEMTNGFHGSTFQKNITVRM